MNRDPYLPLTETTYYTLVALLEPCHGYKILNRVKELSNGQVHLAPGTLYGALEKLQKQDLISLIEEVGPRKKIFRISEKGLEVLENDRLRLIHMTNLLSENSRVQLPGEKLMGNENRKTDEFILDRDKKKQRKDPKENQKLNQKLIQKQNRKEIPKDKTLNGKQMNRNEIKKKNKEEDLFY